MCLMLYYWLLYHWLRYYLLWLRYDLFRLSYNLLLHRHGNLIYYLLVRNLLNYSLLSGNWIHLLGLHLLGLLIKLLDNLFSIWSGYSHKILTLRRKCLHIGYHCWLWLVKLILIAILESSEFGQHQTDLIKLRLVNVNFLKWWLIYFKESSHL